MAKKAKRAHKRSTKIRNLWTSSAPPKEFGREQFRYTLYRSKRKLPTINLNPLVEGANWERQGRGRVGELNFRRPLSAQVATLISHGDKIRCDVAVWGSGHYKRVWEMMVDTPSEQLQEGLITLALKSQLDGATKSKASFKFVKGKHSHVHGWDANEITRHVAKRFHIPLGDLPKAHFKITKLIEHSASPLDVVAKAWRLERLHTGRRFDIDTSRGVLDVRQLHEPKYMLLLAPHLLTDGNVRLGLTGVYSAVYVHGRVKKDGSRETKKISVKVVDKKRVRRYGYVVRSINAPKGHDTADELRKYGKRWLARRAQPHNEISLTVPGIPWLDRANALRIYLPEANVHQIVFVKTARHDVSAGSYTVEITVRFYDPFLADKRKARVKQKKEAAHARRRRQGRGEHGLAPLSKKPPRAYVRSGA